MPIRMGAALRWSLPHTTERRLPWQRFQLIKSVRSPGTKSIMPARLNWRRIKIYNRVPKRSKKLFLACKQPKQSQQNSPPRCGLQWKRRFRRQTKEISRLAFAADAGFEDGTKSRIGSQSHLVNILC